MKKPSKHAALAIEFHSDDMEFRWKTAGLNWSNWFDGAINSPGFDPNCEYEIRPKQPKPIMGHWEYPVAFPRPMMEAPDKRVDYFYLLASGKVSSETWIADDVDYGRLLLGLCYPTKEQAEQRLKAEAAKVFVEDKG